MVGYLEPNNLISKNQHGFRKGSLLELLIHYDEILNNINDNNGTDFIYLDFDKVDHDLLLKKLSRDGIRGKLHSWISSFLKDHTQIDKIVVVNEAKSYISSVISGVPQGTVLDSLALSYL